MPSSYFYLMMKESNVTNIKEIFPKSAHKLAQTEDRAMFKVLLIFIL